MFLDVLLFIFVAINTFLGMGVFLRNTKDRANRFYALFVLFFNIFIVAVFLENRPDLVGIEQLPVFVRLDFASAVLFFFGWLGFCAEFTRSLISRVRYQVIRTVVSTSAVLLVVLSLFTDAILRDIRFFDHVIHFEDGPFWFIYALFLLFCTVASGTVLIKARRTAHREGNVLLKKQLGFILIGFLQFPGSIFIRFSQRWISVNGSKNFIEPQAMFHS